MCRCLPHSHSKSPSLQPNPETRFGNWGLDNNGDGKYDVVEATDDCVSVAPVENSTWGRIKALFVVELDARWSGSTVATTDRV